MRQFPAVKGKMDMRLPPPVPGAEVEVFGSLEKVPVAVAASSDFSRERGMFVKLKILGLCGSLSKHASLALSKNELRDLFFGLSKSEASFFNLFNTKECYQIRSSLF